MKTKTLVIPLNRWPYGLEARQVADGLLLSPKRKPRVNWGKAFKRASQSDGLDTLRQVANRFDATEWQW